jgi:4-carboxymuconolactone decarboxylase
MSLLAIGKPKQIVRKGDVIKCSPGVQHWHVASPESDFAYFPVNSAQNGKTIWLKRLTGEEYHAVQ